MAPVIDAQGPVRLEVEFCHWYFKNGVPPVALTLIPAVPPEQISAGDTGWIRIDGSATTVTAIMADVAVPQPTPEEVI